MDTQEQILVTLGELKGMMQGLLSSRDDHSRRIAEVEKAQPTVNDHQVRIENLEKAQDAQGTKLAWLYGAIAASGVLGGVASKLMSGGL